MVMSSSSAHAALACRRQFVCVSWVCVIKTEKVAIVVLAGEVRWGYRHHVMEVLRAAGMRGERVHDEFAALGRVVGARDEKWLAVFTILECLWTPGGVVIAEEEPGNAAGFFVAPPSIESGQVKCEESTCP